MTTRTSILCVTPNPAIDRTIFVDHLRPGEVHAGLEAIATAGGKGINVARAAHRLGAEVLAVAPIGGPSGDRVAAMLGAESIPVRWVRTAGETRTCTIVVTGDGSATVLNEAGPSMEPADWRRVVAAVREEARAAACVTISGSLPGGIDAGSFRALIEAASAGSPAVWVDASGSLLAEAVDAGVGVKVNQLEVAEHLGVPVPDDEIVGWAADRSFELGGPLVAITLGPEGAVLRMDREVWHASAPTIRTVNPVASGDSFLAGLVTGLVGGSSPSGALALASACGAANAGSRGGADLSPGEVERLLPRVVVERLG